MINPANIPLIKQILTHLDSTFTEEGADEICRLVRLGLWAEKHAVPTLMSIGLAANMEHGALQKAGISKLVKEAMDALPTHSPPETTASPNSEQS